MFVFRGRGDGCCERCGNLGGMEGYGDELDGFLASEAGFRKGICTNTHDRG